jgi:hypothetical protein
MKKAVIGFAVTRRQAEAISSKLHDVGFRTDDISVLFPDERTSHDFGHDTATKAPEGAIAGVGFGGVAGGAIGLLAGIGAIVVPGLGALLAAGPILAVLSGAAIGASVGGVAGALVGMGVPEYEAKLYEGKLRDGNILIAVHSEDVAARRRALDVFKEMHARNVNTKTEAHVPRHN